MRNLLEQQDRLAELEGLLNQCDDNEDIQLNLSSQRNDSNQSRRAVLERIKVALVEYDELERRPYHIRLVLPTEIECVGMPRSDVYGLFAVHLDRAVLDFNQMRCLSPAKQKDHQSI
ncbi:hypothetical protein GCG54_00001171 [Colletotrichum gloeosporioides]|uniref:DUF6594 domain-containing protein n=1 Tax=Colletotrichum gloeosporioides TaxID=474922 RepID=A0A8H4FE66_COLGL|nr:uncharacterized protein GCG54_00001171 [Colletotrichum gloeosporioides]KAF3799067.1 hypothetical protein GCG54_00001171 [Colletotrichum gloeosporioides]